MTDVELQNLYPSAYQWLLERAKPERDTNRDAKTRNKWWLYGRPREELRRFLAGLSWIVATPETSRHRIFVRVPSSVLSDHTTLVVAHEAPWLFGVLQSRIHETWSIAAGTSLGVGNDPRYSHSKTFEKFPFPDLDHSPTLRDRIGDLAERLDNHRKRVQAAVPKAHLTAQYNALTRARDARAGGAPLTATERNFHDQALIGLLQQLHDDLDAAVAQAYGWPADLDDATLLERLVALNRERAAEEARGLVRYLRPDLQAPAQQAVPAAREETDDDTSTEDGAPLPATPPASLPPWPASPASRMLLLRDTLRAADGPMTASELAQVFDGARPKSVLASLEPLVSLGVVAVDPQGRYAPTT